MGVALIGWWLVVASAQEEACGGTLRVEELQEALDATETALAELSVDRADRILDDVVDALRCLGDPLGPSDLGRLARHVALVAFYDADEAELRSWTWLERDTVGGTWPVADLPTPGTFHDLRAELTEPAMVTAAGGWAVPKKGAVIVDGRPSAMPEVRSEVPHLVQVLDRHGEVVWGGWAVGGDLPERWLDPGGVAMEAPAWLDVPPDPEPWSRESPFAGLEEEPEPEETTNGEPAEEPVSSGTGGKPASEPSGGRRRPRRTTEFMEIFPDCPWRQPPSKVEVERASVRVNRHTYEVRRDEDVREVQSVFRSCGEFRAARRLARWSEVRGKLFAGAEAKKQAAGLERVLVGDEPRRGGR